MPINFNPLLVPRCRHRGDDEAGVLTERSSLAGDAGAVATVIEAFSPPSS